MDANGVHLTEPAEDSYRVLVNATVLTHGPER